MKKIFIKFKNNPIIIITIIILISLIVAIFLIHNKKSNIAISTSSNANETFSELYYSDENEIIANDLINIEELLNETNDSLVEDEKSNINIEKNKNKSSEKTATDSNKNNLPYYIKVNYGAQVVTIYKKDDKGNYSIPYKAMICSTGVATPKSGIYSIPRRWEWLGLQGDVYGHYATQITGNILFHSVPYLRKYDPASLEYWEYDKLGTYASAGCVRLTISDAKWIFNNCSKGTKVEFYSSSNPGPLGKPQAKKISSNIECRNWDPTDTNENNPWKNYDKNENTKNENTNNENINTNKENTNINNEKNTENGNTNNENINTNKENTNINNEENTENGNTDKENNNISNEETNTSKEKTNISNEETNTSKEKTNINNKASNIINEKIKINNEKNSINNIEKNNKMK